MLVLYMNPVRGALRRGASMMQGMARGLGRGARVQEATESHDIHDPQTVAHGNAGWVQLLDIEGQRPRGRGRLMLRSEGANTEGAQTFEASVESFVPGDAPVAPGDHVLLLIETANEQYPVTVRAIEAEGSVVSVSWNADELPATLRELGGD